MASVTGPRDGDVGSLLTDAETPPYSTVNADGDSLFLLIGDHAGQRIPAALGTLGLSPADLERHIAWDIGVHALGTALAPMLDAPFIHQFYSRLVIDCNRDPARADAIPEVSDATPIPGNAALPAHSRESRRLAIHQPYHGRIAQEMERRRASGRDTVLVALHSFTPIMQGEARKWQAGVLHHLGDTGMAMRMLDALRRQPDLIVGDNEPYRMDGTDFTVPHHCYAQGIPYIELEIRQDLIADAAGVAHWAALLRDLLNEAAAGRP